MKKNLGLLVIIFGVLLSVLVVIKQKASFQKTPNPQDLKEASFYETLDNGNVRCQLCPNRCVLAPGQRGICKARENINGKLYSLVYGKPVSINVDPIEKKPLYHFLPGTKIYSLATAGCNLDCQYCQNWDIAHRQPEDLASLDMTPQQVVDEALKAKAEAVAFTYNEPTVWYEYMLDIAKLAKQNNLKTVIITAGYINQEPLKQLLPYLDAVKIDFKSIKAETYQTLIKGNLEPVLETIKTVHQSGKWLELVHLVVPGFTDNLEEVAQLCTWIKDNLGPDVPLHLSRFWPKYKLLNLPPTPEKTLKEARKICLEIGLNYVYTGNIDDLEGSTTYCPQNRQPLIQRRGYFIEKNLIDQAGQAPNCPAQIPGVWGK
ncbi:AmmeMemoRadiSam system radical SAM enzyme [Candidatus Shapirobacteria bacterium]|nr:AmmeMemoRadiSam system radical SAM enzyme [Candidatus Shapirobacteria bacterium]